MRALLLLVLIAISPVVQAFPATVRHAGYLLGADELPVTGTRALTFTLHETATGGAAIWTGTFPSVDVNQGYFAVDLNVPAATLAGAADLYLAIAIDAGTALTPRVHLGAVPRAGLADDAATLGGQAPGYYLDASHLGGTLPAGTLPAATTTTPGALAAADKVKLDALDPAQIGTKLQGTAVSAAAPSPGTVLKFVAGSPGAWTPSSLTSADVSGIVPLSGATMTGGLVVPAFQLTTGGGAGKVLTSDASGNASWAAASTGPWATAGSAIHYAGGNVGIGNAVPLSSLSIGGSIGTGYAITANSTQPYGAVVQTSEATPGANPALWVRTTPDGSTVNHLFRVQNNGLVGVNSVSPGANLDVVGPNTGASQANEGGLLFRASDGLGRAAVAAYGNLDGNAPVDSVATALAVREVAGTGRSITTAGSIAVGNGGGGAKSYFQGPLGVGTTNPSSTLEVQGQLKVSGAGATITGLGALKLAAAGGCMSNASAGRYVVEANNSTTCAAACAAAVSGPCAGTCVNGWTWWASTAGTNHYNYGVECTSANPGGGAGKICCCASGGCSVEVFP